MAEILLANTITCSRGKKAYSIGIYWVAAEQLLRDPIALPDAVADSFYPGCFSTIDDL